MSHISNFDAASGYPHFAVICRDTMDSRVAIEQQTFDGQCICDIVLLATVAPHEALRRVQQLERAISGTSFSLSEPVPVGNMQLDVGRPAREIQNHVGA